MIQNAHLEAEFPDNAIGGPLCSGCNCSPRYSPGSDEHEKVVVTGWHIDYEGQVVFCESCVRFLASLIGMIDPEEQKVRVTDVRRQERRDQKTRAAAASVHEARQAASEAVQTLDTLIEELDL